MSAAGSAPLLEVRDLHVRYPAGRGALGRAPGHVAAVRGVDLTVLRGETLALVGESGCGKSSLARAALRLQEPASGVVRFDGADVTAMDRAALRAFRRRAQIVFQDPGAALNPRLRVGATLVEALKVHGLGGRHPGGRAIELLEMVGLGAEHLARYPHELSGGQRQRLGIARALSVEPDLLVLDEPVSALDVSVRAQVVNLLEDLQDRLGLTYLFIALDLAVVRHVSHRVAVMYLGRIVEVGPKAQVYATPRHPYTRALLSAVPGRGRGTGGTGGRIVLPGDVPDPARPPAGCAFHPRCLHPDKDASCSASVPALDSVAAGRFVACFKARRGA